MRLDQASFPGSGLRPWVSVPCDCVDGLEYVLVGIPLEPRLEVRSHSACDGSSRILTLDPLSSNEDRLGTD
jgi:hypothetical protein